MNMAWVIRREWFCCSPYLVQKNLWRTNILNARWGFKHRVSFFSRLVGASDPPWMHQQRDFSPLGGRFGSGPHSDASHASVPPQSLLLSQMLGSASSSCWGRGGKMRRLKPTPCIPLPVQMLIFPLLKGAEFLSRTEPTGRFWCLPVAI